MTVDMRTPGDDSFAKAGTWDGAWHQHFQEYQGDFRHAYYIAAIRRRRERRVLELAAGSFRDMAALNRWGVCCEGVDFSGESVRKAADQFPTLRDRIKQMDARHLDYPDGAFDLTFHAGFWVYFDDAQIAEMAAEQARVSRYRMTATVHNAQHRGFQEYLAELAQKDRFYRVRFFHPEEIIALLQPYCRRVIVLPAMTGRRLDRSIFRRHLGPTMFRAAYQLYGRFERLETSERLLCIGEVAD